MIDYSKLRLVALDDDPLNSELIARNARRCGYEAKAVVDPDELPSVVRSWLPHVITLDLRMPQATGSEVISRLAGNGFAGEILFVSGLGLTVLDAVCDQARAKGLAVAGAMQKPLDLGALRQLLTTIRTRTTGEAA